MPLTDDQIRAMLRDTSRFPPSAKLMGMELIDLSSAEGWAEFAFNPPASFANPAGNVQGGFICGMLDDAMALSSTIAQGFKALVPTLQMSVTFIAPAPLTRLIARGETLRVGKNTTQMQGTLKLPDGTLLAVAAASAVIRPFPRAPATAG
jgi:uncharacterized protein (TIGR00369 family)